MPKIGDRVRITIPGGAVIEGSTGTSVSPGGFLMVGGKIIEDLGDSWLIKTDISVAGRDRMVVSKSAYQVA